MPIVGDDHHAREPARVDVSAAQEVGVAEGVQAEPLLHDVGRRNLQVEQSLGASLKRIGMIIKKEQRLNLEIPTGCDIKYTNNLRFGYGKPRRIEGRGSVRGPPADRDQGDFGITPLELRVDRERALHPELDMGVNLALPRQPASQNDDSHP